MCIWPLNMYPKQNMQQKLVRVNLKHVPRASNTFMGSADLSYGYGTCFKLISLSSY